MEIIFNFVAGKHSDFHIAITGFCNHTFLKSIFNVGILQQL